MVSWKYEFQYKEPDQKVPGKFYEKNSIPEIGEIKERKKIS